MLLRADSSARDRACSRCIGPGGSGSEGVDSRVSVGFSISRSRSPDDKPARELHQTPW